MLNCLGKQEKQQYKEGINGLTSLIFFKISPIIFSLDKYKPMAYILAMTSDELRKWREVNGYSQARLAKALAVAVMTVSRWERGVRAIPPFLHLALRLLELEGGGPEIVRRGRKKKMGKEV
jgi:DNA-binding transcriptional regulator YiaG